MNELGFTYLVVLVGLAIMSMAAALTLEVAETQARRSEERELIGIGREFERAFASYYRQSPQGAVRFPKRLEDLTLDPRFPGIRRHLRKLYADPLTHEAWGTVPAPGGGIMAVYSTSQEQPFGELPVPLAAASPASAASAASASNASSYADWRFGYDPALDLRNRQRFILPTPYVPPGAASTASAFQ